MTNGSRDDVLTLKEQVAEVLARVGLRLSEAKTQVRHLSEGIDILGFHIQWRKRRGGGKWCCMVFIAGKASAKWRVIMAVRPTRRVQDKEVQITIIRNMGPVASAPTEWRALNELTPAALRRVERRWRRSARTCGRGWPPPVGFPPRGWPALISATRSCWTWTPRW
jgi:hypothetical protein